MAGKIRFQNFSKPKEVNIHVYEDLCLQTRRNVMLSSLNHKSDVVIACFSTLLEQCTYVSVCVCECVRMCERVFMCVCMCVCESVCMCLIVYLCVCLYIYIIYTACSITME